jgi:hypothetical protein
VDNTIICIFKSFIHHWNRFQGDQVYIETNEL